MSMNLDALDVLSRTEGEGEDQDTEAPRSFWYRMLRGRGRIGWLVGVPLLIVAVLLAFLLTGGAGFGDLPMYEATRGDLDVTVTEAGELRAAKGEFINAPEVHNWHGRLKIVRLRPEGDEVKVGDLVIEFDREEYLKDITDGEAELQHARAEMEKVLARQRERISGLKGTIEDKGASLRLSEINLQKMTYESQVEIERAGLNLKRAQTALVEAKRNLETQEIVDRVERRKNEIAIAKKEENLERSKKDYESLSVRATAPGIVVYEKIRKSGRRREKVRVGDEVWGGHSLVKLPDLSEMEVETQVNEIDAQRIRVGQGAIVKLDAFPGLVFHGRVKQVAPLAQADEEAFNVQIFEVVISIEEQHDNLRPGMSAMSEIVVESVPDVVYIPVEAVFERDDRLFVYRIEGGRRAVPVDVTAGKRNDTYVVIEDGVSEGDVVALADPTAPRGEEEILEAGG